jgi:hypothetical protein
MCRPRDMKLYNIKSRIFPFFRSDPAQNSSKLGANDGVGVEPEGAQEHTLSLSLSIMYAKYVSRNAAEAEFPSESRGYNVRLLEAQFILSKTFDRGGPYKTSLHREITRTSKSKASRTARTISGTKSVTNGQPTRMCMCPKPVSPLQVKHSSPLPRVLELKSGFRPS